MSKIGQNWGKIANYPPQCSTKICTTGSEDKKKDLRPKSFMKSDVSRGKHQFGSLRPRFALQ